MQWAHEIVITGAGVVSPIGTGNEAYWTALMEGRSGVRTLSTFQGSDLPPPICGEVLDFDPNKFVRPRKALKVMSRDIQLGVAAANLASTMAAIRPGSVDPDRFGVVYGGDMIPGNLQELVEVYKGCTVDGRFDFNHWGGQAMTKIFPLWMLKYLPNMPACHVAIAQDARGPNNSLTMGEVSSLAAVGEAIAAIGRGQADVMIAGGASSRLHPGMWLRFRNYPVSCRHDDPAGACRPFDADRDGMVFGEGAAAFLLETRRHAEARGATPLAKVLGFASACEPCRSADQREGTAIRCVMRLALERAGLRPGDVGHVNAHGIGTPLDDRIEAQAIRQVLDSVAVTAIKSYVGNLGAASGAVELAASVLGLGKGRIPATLNYHRPDPDCPVHVIAGQPLPVTRPTAMVLNHAPTGQATALVLAAM